MKKIMLCTSYRRVCAGLFLFVLFSGLASVRATITAVNYWRMGENDPGAGNGLPSTNTLDAVGGQTLTNTFTNAGGYPVYSSIVSSLAATATGSTLSLLYSGRQSTKGNVLSNLTNNFGMELWMYPATNSGGAVVAYNGNTGLSGCGIYQANAALRILFGGVSFVGTVPLATNTWTHVALVCAGGVTTLYTNGVSTGVTSSIGVAPSGNFLVAANNSGGENFFGRVDELRVFTFAAGQFSTSNLLVNQALALATSSLAEGPAAGTDSVVLATGTPATPWTAMANVSWLQVAAGFQSGSASTNFIFTFAANPGPTRTGAITINNATLTVTQAGSAYVAAGPMNRLPLIVSSSSVGNAVGITVDGSGNVYVPDLTANVIRKWQPGNLQETAFSNSVPGGPYNLVADAAGVLFIVDEDNNALEERTAANGTFQVLVQLAGGVSAAISQLAVDMAGNVYAADGASNSIDKWTAASGAYAALVTNLNGPVGVAVDFAGNLYIAQANINQVTEWAAATGALSPLVTNLNQPSAVAVDAFGQRLHCGYRQQRAQEMDRGHGRGQRAGLQLDQSQRRRGGRAGRCLSHREHDHPGLRIGPGLGGPFHAD